MAVAVVFDPAIVVNSGDSALTVKSAAASPAADTVIVAVVTANSLHAAARTYSVANSGVARTWVEAVRRNYTEASTDGYAAVFYAVNPTAQSNITVTATSLQNDGWTNAAIKLYVLSGVDLADPVGAVAEMSSSTTGTKSVSLTAETAGAVGIAGTVNWDANNFPSTSSTLSGYKTYSTGSVTGAYGYRALGAAGSANTLSFVTSSGGFTGHVVAAEFRAAAASVSRQIVGATAQTTADAPAGGLSLSQTVAGATAAVASTSPPGAAKPTPATVVGVTSSVTTLAPAGSAGEFATIAGATAAVLVDGHGGEWVPPALLLVATPDPSATPPRVRLDVRDTRTAKAEQVSVYRIEPDGRARLVRTSDDGPLPMSGGSGVLWDYEAPYGADFSYTTDDPGTRQVSARLDVEVPWLVHPGVPSRSVPVDFRAGTNMTEAWGIEQGLFAVLGRATPIVVTSGARMEPASELILSTTSREELAAVKLALSDGSPLLLNVPTTLDAGLDSVWIAVGNVQVRRLSDVGSDPHRDIELGYQVVDRPAGGTQAAVSWLTVASEYASYEAIVAAGVESWAALAAPTT